MFVEGFYLFLVVYYTYRAEEVAFHWFALIGWGIPGVLAVVRIIVDAIKNPLKLWVLEGCDRYLVTIPVLSMLGLNALFLIAILYALSGKLRRSFTPAGIIATPPPSIRLERIGHQSPDTRPLPGACARLSCPPMLPLSSSEIYHHRHHPSTNDELTSGNSSNNRSRITSAILLRLSLRRSLDLVAQGGQRTCRPNRSASDSGCTKFRRAEVQSNMCFSGAKVRQKLSPNPLSNQSRTNSSLGNRIRLGKIVNRVNARDFVKTVKAGLMLMPLLGLPEIIFITPYHPSLKPAFDLITAFLRSTQGFWVSLLYCFLTHEVQQQLANRKHVFSVRSSIRPNQSWPPLLRQQSPCTQGSTLLDLFDHQSILNVFLIRQRQNVTREYFIASGDILKREGLDASPFIVEFAKFRNTKLYDRTPVRGMRYIVVRCNRDGALTSVKRRLDSDKGFLEMEKYLYSYSPRYHVYEQIQNLFPEVKPTQDMVKSGVSECSFRREFQVILVERHLEPMFREPSCPDLDVQKISAWENTEEGRAGFRKHLNERITDWVWILNREKRHYDWVIFQAKMESSSFLKGANNSKFGDSFLGNSSKLLSAKMNLEERTKYSPLFGDSKSINQTKNDGEQVADDGREQVGDDSDKDGKNEDNKSDESNQDKSLLNQPSISPEFSRSIIRIIYRGTRAMVRLQLLTEMYIHMFNEAPDYFAE
ncbi:hypothetical protein FBUS_01422 [Fasciolopsis buskii]|uniref:G-protein coupled receptors family 2 profile 2 domain-containing protein n=1 Tax=Fasciolopsis buskii TaxID=27845 RepID=A0A8E0RYM3_9TREM|nr:hypothetical protein FBUS_01422 [Fasciolopsis buski]